MIDNVFRMHSCSLTFSLSADTLDLIKEAIGEFSIYASVLQSKLGLMISCQTTLPNSDTISDGESDDIEIARGPTDKRVTFYDPFLSYDPDLYNPSGTYSPRKRYKKYIWHFFNLFFRASKTVRQTKSKVVYNSVVSPIKVFNDVMEDVEERVRTSSICSSESQKISPKKSKRKSPKRIKSTPKPVFNVASVSQELDSLTVTESMHQDLRIKNLTKTNSPKITPKKTVVNFSCRFCSKPFDNLRLVRRHEIVFCTKDWTTAFKDH